MRFPTFDLYAEIGISPGAGRAEIVKAFRRAAKTSHPDVSHDDRSTARMARLNLAREILADPITRAAYDAQRGATLLRHVRTRPPPPPTPRPRSTRTRGGRAPLNECPICPHPDRSSLGHCALGHAGGATPRFGRARRFAIDADEHGAGCPFQTPQQAQAHASWCGWFARTQAGGGRDTGWQFESPAYPAVGRIRRRDRVAIEPDLLEALASVADETALRDSLAYAADGRVILLIERGGILAAIVCGRQPYGVRVVLGVDGRMSAPSSWACTCPSYRSPCKHVLAAWIVWRAGAD